MFSPTCKSIFAAAVWPALMSDDARSQSKFAHKLLAPGRNTLVCYTVKNGKESPIGGIPAVLIPYTGHFKEWITINKAR